VKARACDTDFASGAKVLCARIGNRIMTLSGTLRERTGDHDGLLGVLEMLRQCYADLEVAVRRLASEVPEDGAPSRAAVELVQRRLAALGEALSAPAADG
jgi:hypothetical protein